MTSPRPTPARTLGEDVRPLEAFFQGFDEFVYFPSIRWDHTWERQQTLIKAFADAHPDKSGYLFPPLGLVPYSPFRGAMWSRAGGNLRNMMRRPVAQRPLGGHPLPPNIVPVRPFFIPGVGGWRRKVTLMCSRRIRELSRPKGRRFLLASYANDIVTTFAASADFVVLDLAERRQASSRLTAYAKGLERALARQADVLVADNRAVLEDYSVERAERGASGHYVPQGFTAFYGETQQRPMHRRDGPIAYLGNLHRAIDYEWLKVLIAAHPTRTFRLCGMVMDGRADGVLCMPNVEFWGRIAHSQIPEFLRGASWGLIPYVLNEWTAGVFPTKLFEYLDAGVPVLSTPLPEVMQYREFPFVRIHQDPTTDLPHAETSGIDVFLRDHTWSARLDTYARILVEATR